MQGLVDVIENADLSKEEIQQLAELIKDDPVIAQAVEQFNERAAENTNAPMPYTLADAATEVQAEAIVEGLTEAFTDPGAAFSGAAESFEELWGCPPTLIVLDNLVDYKLCSDLVLFDNNLSVKN